MKLQLRDRTGDLTVVLVNRDPLRVVIRQGEQETAFEVPVPAERDRGRIAVGNRLVSYHVTETPEAFWVTLAGQTFCFDKSHGEGADLDQAVTDFTAPMPGRIVDVPVSEGDRVEAGDVLVVMEAMKMEHRIEAPSAGRITALRCQAGELVEQGYALLDFEADPASE